MLPGLVQAHCWWSGTCIAAESGSCASLKPQTKKLKLYASAVGHVGRRGLHQSWNRLGCRHVKSSVLGGLVVLVAVVVVVAVAVAVVVVVVVVAVAVVGLWTDAFQVVCSMRPDSGRHPKPEWTRRVEPVILRSLVEDLSYQQEPAVLNSMKSNFCFAYSWLQSGLHWQV